MLTKSTTQASLLQLRKEKVIQISFLGNDRDSIELTDGTSVFHL